MIIEAGLFSLCLAFVMSLGMSSGSLWMREAQSLKTAQLFLSRAIALTVAMSFLALTQAYIGSDFSVLNVYANSHPAKPLIYKITGVWGNHEGSFLFLLLITAIAQWIWHERAGRDISYSVISQLLGLFVGAYTAFSLFTSDPFERLWPAPLTGEDLNPLLQDPALAIHPPLLYVGYTGFAVVFAMTFGALWRNSFTQAFARSVYSWTLGAWLFLSAGLAVGSYWAYYELGWGGWWFWDPVENAALVPWLTGTALLHSLIVFRKTGALKNWTILLALLTFSLTLLGIFLVRSGVLVSVHSFASDPQRGLFILLIFALFTGTALTLYGAKIRESQKPLPDLFSRGGGILMNNILFTFFAFIVALGTLYPVLVQGMGGGLQSVGPFFYERMLLFFAPLFLLLMLLAPSFRWSAGALTLPEGLGLSLLIAMTVSIYLLSDNLVETGAVMLLFAILAGFAESVREGIVRIRNSAFRLKHLAFPLAHAGFALAMAGMIISAYGQQETVVSVNAGETFSFAGYQVRLAGMEEVEGPNYLAQRADLAFTGPQTFVLQPERRYYPVAETFTTEAAIDQSLWRDVYVVHGGPDKANPGGWVVRVYYNPCINWIWLGIGITILGGLFSLFSRRGGTSG